MSQPTHQDVHADAALTDMSVAYIQDTASFVASRVFASKPVQHKTNKYYVFDKAAWFRTDGVKKRAPGQAAPRVGWTLSTTTYDCEAWWTAVPLNEIARANSDPAVPYDEAGTRLVTQRMLTWREVEFASSYFTTGIWGTDVVGGTDFTVWDDATSDPEKDIQTAKETVKLNTGLMPNRMVVGLKVHHALKRHPLIKDRYKYTSSESITASMLAAYFEVDDYIIADGVYSTAAEDTSQTFTGAFALGNHCLLFHYNGAPDLMTPTAATNFIWTGLTGLNDLGVRIDQYYDPDKKEDVVRGEFAFDMKVTGSDLGYFFSSCIA